METERKPIVRRTAGTTEKAKIDALAELGQDKVLVETNTNTSEFYVKDNENNTSNQEFLRTTNGSQESVYQNAFAPPSETPLMRFIRELNEYSDDDTNYQFTGIS